MSTITTGLFKSQNQAQEIAADLESSGFGNQDYILYVHNYPLTKEVKTNLWQSFFKDKTVLQDESLVVSVRVRNDNQKQLVKEIFEQHHCVHQNYIENIKFSDAQSLSYLKKIVALRARAAVKEAPGVTHRPASDGMNSEVLFGK